MSGWRQTAATFISSRGESTLGRWKGLASRSRASSAICITGACRRRTIRLQPVDLMRFGEAVGHGVGSQRHPPDALAGLSRHSFQNGVSKEEVLRDVLGPASVVGGPSYIESSMAEPGVIQHGGTMQQLVFGGCRKSTPRIQTFLKRCQEDGIDSEISADITRPFWKGSSSCLGCRESPRTFEARSGRCERTLAQDSCSKRGYGSGRGRWSGIQSSLR